MSAKSIFSVLTAILFSIGAIVLTGAWIAPVLIFAAGFTVSVGLILLNCAALLIACGSPKAALAKSRELERKAALAMLLQAISIAAVGALLLVFAPWAYGQSLALYTVLTQSIVHLLRGQLYGFTPQAAK